MMPILCPPHCRQLQDTKLINQQMVWAGVRNILPAAKKKNDCFCEHWNHAETNWPVMPVSATSEKRTSNRTESFIRAAPRTRELRGAALERRNFSWLERGESRNFTKINPANWKDFVSNTTRHDRWGTVRCAPSGLHHMRTRVFFHASQSPQFPSAWAKVLVWCFAFSVSSLGEMEKKNKFHTIGRKSCGSSSWKLGRNHF